MHRGRPISIALAGFMVLALSVSDAAAQAKNVTVEWLSWSFYRITSPGGKVILTNPWYTNPDSSITLNDIPEADIILDASTRPDRSLTTRPFRNAQPIAMSSLRTIWRFLPLL